MKEKHPLIRRFVLRTAGELAGLLFLVLFVVALATMPPLRVNLIPGAFTTYRISVDTAAWKQSARGYWETVSQGSLGVDKRRREVGPRVADRFKNSMILIGAAAGLAIGLGVLKGVLDFNSLRRGQAGLGLLVTGAVQGLPDFWLILILQAGSAWLFSKVGWRPFSVAYSSSDPYNSLVFPLICLSLIPASYVARMTGTALLDVWGQDYIRTARAKGLHDFKVVFKHAFRNAAVQVMDSLPNLIGIMVANLLIVEYLFNYPGLTVLLKEAIPAPTIALDRPSEGADVPVLVAAGLCLGLTFTVLHLTVDLLRRIADPRLREGNGA